MNKPPKHIQDLFELVSPIIIWKCKIQLFSMLVHKSGNDFLCKQHFSACTNLFRYLNMLGVVLMEIIAWERDQCGGEIEYHLKV